MDGYVSEKCLVLYLRHHYVIGFCECSIQNYISTLLYMKNIIIWVNKNTIVSIKTDLVEPRRYRVLVNE